MTHTPPQELPRTILGVLLLILLPMNAVQAQSQGCPQAHCNQANTDFANLAAPTGATVDTVWFNNDLAGESRGSHIGLGCSANGFIAVCSYIGPAQDTVVAYNFAGGRPWESDDKLNGFAFTSAPLVLPDDSTIAVDSFRAIRFDVSGGEMWNQTLREDGQFAGYTISPVRTDSGVIVFATKGGRDGYPKEKGMIYARDEADGALLGTLVVEIDINDPGAFETQNTPAVVGNRLYISMQHLDVNEQPDGLARLVAIDVDRNETPDKVLQVKWYYDDYRAPSASSPLVLFDSQLGANVVYFDGRRTDTSAPLPAIFAVSDQGTSGNKEWEMPLTDPAFASFAADPRGDHFFQIQKNSSLIYRRQTSNGEIASTIDVDALIGESGNHEPSSAMTIAGTAADPILIIGAADLTASAYVLAIDLNGTPGPTPTKLWAVPTDPLIVDPAPGQFPLLTNGSDTRVVYTTCCQGARAIGAVTP